MIPAIKTRLKTGSIKNVVVHGTKDIPSLPYIDIKPEIHPVGRGIRCIVHFPPDYQLDLEDYVFNEISELMRNFKGTDRHGNKFVVKDDEEYSDIAVRNDDDSLSMERVFYVPQRLR